MTRCRACKEEVPYEEWQEHVKRHKIEFCLRVGLDPQGWWEVNWENVIRLFNKEEAKPRPEEMQITKEQIKLTRYLKTNTIII